MVDFLLNLADPWAYVVIALLVAGEAAAFIGLVLPGETAIFLGGVLAFEGRVDLTALIVVACVSAIVGDTIGYEVGKHLGPRMRDGRIGRLVGEERWDRATSFLRRHGGRSVFLGRWVGVLRALVPSLAGAARIPYRTFLFFNVLGGTTWAVTFIFLGYLGGSSWRTVEHEMGRATAAVVALAVFVAIVIFTVRFVSNHRADIALKRDELLERPMAAAFRRRFRRQIDFLARRLDPTQRFGLYMSIGVVVLAAAGWLFGAVLQDVVAHDELALIDLPTARWLIDHREPWLNATMKVITGLGSRPFLTVATVAAVLTSWFTTRSIRWPLLFVVAAAGADALEFIVKLLVSRPRPDLAPLIHAGGYAFPSGHATVATAFFGALAYYLSVGRRWSRVAAIWVVAISLIGIVGFSRVYLGVHWLSDVLGGFGLGALWLVLTVMATSMLDPRQPPSVSVGAEAPDGILTNR